MPERLTYGYQQSVEYDAAHAHREHFDAVAVEGWKEHAAAKGLRTVGDPTSIDLLRDRFPEGGFDGLLVVRGPAEWIDDGADDD